MFGGVVGKVILDEVGLMGRSVVLLEMEGSAATKEFLASFEHLLQHFVVGSAIDRTSNDPETNAASVAYSGVEMDGLWVTMSCTGSRIGTKKDPSAIILAVRLVFERDWSGVGINTSSVEAGIEKAASRHVVTVGVSVFTVGWRNENDFGSPLVVEAVLVEISADGAFGREVGVSGDGSWSESNVDNKMASSVEKARTVLAGNIGSRSRKFGDTAVFDGTSDGGLVGTWKIHIFESADDGKDADVVGMPLQYECFRSDGVRIVIHLGSTQ